MMAVIMAFVQEMMVVLLFNVHDIQPVFVGEHFNCGVVEE